MSLGFDTACSSSNWVLYLDHRENLKHHTIGRINWLAFKQLGHC
jgi:hypothetical protein